MNLATKDWKVLSFLFLALTWYIPFSTVISMHIGSLASLIRDGTLLLLILCLFAVLSKKKNIRFNIFNLLLLIYIVYGFLHIFFSLTDFTDALSKFRLLYLYPTLALLIILIFKGTQKKRWHTFFLRYTKIFYLQGIIILVFALLELLFQESLLMFLYRDSYFFIQRDLLGQEGIRLVSLMYNPINLGLFLNLFLVYLLYNNQSRSYFAINNTLFKLILVALTLAVLLLTFSRITYIIAVITLLLYVIINFKKILSLKRVFLLVIFIPILLFSMQTVIADQVDNLNKRIDQLSSSHARENVRLENWNDYLEAVTSQGNAILIWGGGLGTSNSDSSEQAEFVKRVENSYVSFLGEIGIIGLVMFLLILLRMTYNIKQKFKIDVAEAKFLMQIFFSVVIGWVYKRHLPQ